MASVSGKTIISSILRSTTSRTSLQNRISDARGKVKVRFEFPQEKKVHEILHAFLQGENVQDYENLIIRIRDSDLSDHDVHLILTEASECLSILNQDLRLFVESILSIRWIDRSDEIVTEYQTFLVNLLPAHIYHTSYAVDKLVTTFITNLTDEAWPDGIPSELDNKKCSAVHWVFNILLEVIPTCEKLVIKWIIAHFPYITKSAHVHEYYIHNLLWLMDYRSHLRPDILHLIFSKLVLLDSNASRETIQSTEEEGEELFSMDGDTIINNGNMRKHEANALDLCLDKLFKYYLMECHDWEKGALDWDKAKNLYHDMLRIFDSILLPAYHIHHVQFSMFVLCSYRTSIAEAFLNHLWKKVVNPMVPAITRQAAVSYIASLVARGTFVPLGMLKGTLQQITEWVHNYILQQDGLEYIKLHIRAHSVFYTVCQALFYIIAFRQKDLVNTRKNITFVETLNLSKIVTCRLNPLRVCLPAVVQNFAAVTRTYQFAYCYAIMEHNSRNQLATIHRDEKGAYITSEDTLDAFFPFDPYLLKRSSKQIHPFYLDYQKPVTQESVEDVEFTTAEQTECDVDDFLECSTADRFSYGTSPGFKFKK